MLQELVERKVTGLPIQPVISMTDVFATWLILATSKNGLYHLIIVKHIYPYGSKYLLRRNLTPQIMPQVLPLEGTWIHMDISVLIISANKIINFSCLKVKTYEKPVLEA